MNEAFFENVSKRNNMGATMGKSGSNFLDAIPSQSTMHVVMLGLDSAGKTTALYRLKFDQYLNTVPTIGFNCEKVQGTIGKAKGIQFLVWDVGGQEKLRPLWRSYTRCTDGILFVVDSVDVERMEEAKMELMRTAKCPDNQGVPVLILANKQDLPGACDPKDLEKLLGLYELVQQDFQSITTSKLSTISSSSTGNIVGCSNNSSSSSGVKYSVSGRSLTPTSHHSKSFGADTMSEGSSLAAVKLQSKNTFLSNSSLMEQSSTASESQFRTSSQQGDESMVSTPAAAAPSPVSIATTSSGCPESDKGSTSNRTLQYKGWYIQPACAITGEGLQEGLEALYEMILKRRKMSKAHKKKR